MIGLCATKCTKGLLDTHDIIQVASQKLPLLTRMITGGIGAQTLWRVMLRVDGNGDHAYLITFSSKLLLNLRE